MKLQNLLTQLCLDQSEEDRVRPLLTKLCADLQDAEARLAAAESEVAGLRAALEKCREVFHHWDGNSVTAGHFRQLVEAKELTEAALRPAHTQTKGTTRNFNESSSGKPALFLDTNEP